MNRKYQLGSPEKVRHPLRAEDITVYRVVALRDIPYHGVKAGDVGGYVDHRKVLSQKGDCWIGGDALVLDKSFVKDDAIVKDKAVVSLAVVSDNGAIYGQAKVFGLPGRRKSRVSDSAEIYDEAQVISSEVDGHSQIHEAATVTHAFVYGYSVVSGFAEIGPAVFIRSSKIYGYAEVHRGAEIKDSAIHCQVMVHQNALVENSHLIANGTVKEGERVYGRNMTKLRRGVVSKTGQTSYCSIDGHSILNCDNLYHEKTLWPFTPEAIEEIAAAPTTAKAKPSERKRLDVIEQKYAEYENDIVKIIKYPVMTDLTDAHTAKFHSALHKTRRLYDEGDMPAYKESLDALEDSFHIAESNARKISLSQLVPDERNKVTGARQMLAIALDDAASETEKKNAFKGAMRNLEGIVAVPEAALSSLRQRIGLLEIEA